MFRYNTVFWLLDGYLWSEHNFRANFLWSDFGGRREALDILQVIPIFFCMAKSKFQEMDILLAANII